ASSKTSSPCGTASYEQGHQAPRAPARRIPRRRPHPAAGHDPAGPGRAPRHAAGGADERQHVRPQPRLQQAESALREAEGKVRATVLANGNGWVIGVKCGNDPARGGLADIDDSKCGGMPASTFSGGAICTDLTGDCWFNATDQLGAGNNSAGAPQYYVQYLGLRDSHDELGLGSSAGSVQYGGGGGG